MVPSSQHWRAPLLPGWPCRGWSGPAWPGSSPRCPPTRARGSRACRGWGRPPRPATQVTWPALHQSQLTCSTTPWPELWTSTRPVTLTPSSTAPGTRSTTAAAHVSRVTCQLRWCWSPAILLRAMSYLPRKGKRAEQEAAAARASSSSSLSRGRWQVTGDRWQVTGAWHLTSC